MKASLCPEVLPIDGDCPKHLVHISLNTSSWPYHHLLHIQTPWIYLYIISVFPVLFFSHKIIVSMNSLHLLGQYMEGEVSELWKPILMDVFTLVTVGTDIPEKILSSKF